MNNLSEIILGRKKLLSTNEAMFIAAVKEYIRQFPGVWYEISPERKVFYISTGDSDLDYEISQRVQELAEYYDCEDLFND
jgi:hypothetical protein